MDYAAFVDDIGGALAAALVDDWLRRADDPAVAWTGSIESTVLLWLAVELRDRREQIEGVTAIFVDHGCHYEETEDFVATVADAWDVRLVTTGNVSLLDEAGPDAVAPVDALDEGDRRRLRRAGHEGDAVALDPRTATGRLLLDAGPLHDALAEAGHDVLLAGDREDPDDQPGERVYAQEVGDAVRVAPLTHLTERDVWRIAIGSDLPVNPVYGRGHRSVRSALGGEPADDHPAWDQVLGADDGDGNRGDAEGETDVRDEEDGEGAGELDRERERSLMDRLREAGS